MGPAFLGTAFLGAQLQCAECYDHPFAPWTQADFWGLFAYFGKLRNTGTKGPPWVITEAPDPGGWLRGGAVGPLEYRRIRAAPGSNPARPRLTKPTGSISWSVVRSRRSPAGSCSASPRRG